MTLVLTGTITVPAARRAEVRLALPEHIRLTLAEPGCLSFDVTENPDTAGEFHVSETFCDRAAFDAHQQRTQKSPWAEVTRDIPRAYVLKDLSL